MRRFIPYGYGTTRGGSVCALFIMLWSAFLISRFIGYPGGPEACGHFAMTACPLALLFILSDIITNRIKRSKNKYMDDMLQQPFVCGRIVAITPIHKHTRKEIKEEELRTVRGKYILYNMTVEYDDPISGQLRTATSEPYFQNLNVFLSGKRVEVHYDPAGNIWVEPVEYRESMEEESIGSNKKANDRHFWVVEHSSQILIVLYCFYALLIFLIIKSV